MSALDTLPPDLRATIASGTARPGTIRDDLRLIPVAEAEGWIVSFPNGSWHNEATFERREVVVWGTGRDWRRGFRADQRARSIEVFASLAKALGLPGETP